MRILDFVLGRNVVSTPRKNAAKLLNICMRNSIAYRVPHFDGQSFLAEYDERSFRRLNTICRERGIDICLAEAQGLPNVLRRYRGRYGILVGALIAIIVLCASFNVIWRVELVGNETVAYGEIEALLAENHISVGERIPGEGLALVENKIISAAPDIAWLSVNMDGTVARVEIREQKSPVKTEAGNADLVASRDGKVERIEVFDGSVAVNVGDVVKKGDLLVSGGYMGEAGITRYVRAEGSVFARTVRQFSVEVPFKQSEKIYTGRKKCEISVNFFKKSIKIFSNSGKLYPSCDIIYENGEMGLGRLGAIPVGYRKTLYPEYKTVEKEISEAEAMEKAFDILEQELSLLSESVELLRKNIEYEITEGEYILKCELVCIEDIAAVREIYITD